MSQRTQEVAAVEIVEVAEVLEEEEEIELLVDVSGAVVLPGLYRILSGARVGEAIALAGGLSDQADYAQVARSINLAQAVTDGMKIYVPCVGDQEAFVSQESGSSMGGAVSINHASAAELEELWGIGSARSAAIIGNRPYTSIDELVTKAGIPASVVEKNQELWGL